MLLRHISKLKKYHKKIKTQKNSKQTNTYTGYEVEGEIFTAQGSRRKSLGASHHKVYHSRVLVGLEMAREG